MVAGFLVFLFFACMAFWILIVLGAFAIPYALNLYFMDWLKTKVFPKLKKDKA